MKPSISLTPPPPPLSVSNSTNVTAIKRATDSRHPGKVSAVLKKYTLNNGETYTATQLISAGWSIEQISRLD